MRTLLPLPPAILLGGEISVPGDVRHVRLGEETSTEQDGALVNERTQRTTLREVHDLEGHKAAKSLESHLRSRLSNLAPRSGFGRLCPVARADDLTAFLAEAREAAAAFNAAQAARSGRHYLRVTLVAARIADATDDAEALADSGPAAVTVASAMSAA